MTDHRRRIHRKEARTGELAESPLLVLDDASTDSRNRLSNRAGQAMRVITKWEKDVCSKSVFDFGAELRPMRSLKNRREFLYELLYERSNVRSGMSNCERGFLRKEDKVIKRFIVLGKLIERRVKAWIAADGAKTKVCRGPAVNYSNR